MDDPQEPPRQRRRPPRSCITCRRRKVKCDHNDPCTPCTFGGWSCAYRSDPRLLSRQGYHHSHATGPITPISRVKTSQVLAERCETSRPSSDAAIGDSGNGPSLTTGNSVSPAENGHRAECSSSILLQDLQTSFSKSRVTKHGKTLVMSNGLRNSIAVFQEITEASTEQWSEDPEIHVVIEQCRQTLHQCKRIAREVKAQQRPTRRLAHPGLILSPPNRAHSDHMARLYFQYFESTNRILHAPTFWTEYELYWTEPGKAPLSLRFKILLVVAIGSSLDDQSKTSEFRNSIWQWVYAAQTWLSGPLEKDRVNVEAVTVHCLLLLTRAILNIGTDLIWASSGSLVNRAFQIGLHRDPKHLPKMSILQAEIRRRLWATILEIVLQSSLDSEMRPRISPKDYDTEPPSNVYDVEISESTSIHPYPVNQLTSTSIQLLLINCVPLRLEILETLHGIEFEIPYAKTLDLHSRMVASIASYDSISGFSDPTMAFQRNMLDFMMRRFLLHLHSSFAFRAANNHSFHFSQKASLDAAFAIISPEPDEKFETLMRSGSGVFKTGVRLASAVVGLEIVSHTQAQREDLSLRRTSAYRESLKCAMQTLLSLAEARLRCGEFNVKDHLFVATVVAEVAAIEAGTPIYFAMVQGAKTSLEKCHGILLGRYGAACTLSTPTLDTDMNADFGVDDVDFDVWSFLQYTDLQ